MSHIRRTIIQYSIVKLAFNCRCIVFSNTPANKQRRPRGRSYCLPGFFDMTTGIWLALLVYTDQSNSRTDLVGLPFLSIWFLCDL
ncbi:hypothetical protein BDN72DRAFT_592068 [Pluteus cervinus]|uniref:Uncharacterized protein n=1 Tax=Pluteus cervinus TaxID=181527 RepID=A0ACD3AVB4_9AGAR|nr:hypothetical protein BDN72DRAFT_592068 [Pluteus cervinus]